MPTIWRLNLKTAASEGVDPRMLCVAKNILGIGWAVDSEGELDWDAYYKLGEETYYNQGDNGWWPAINAIKNRMELNDLCWTRDWNGIYYLGRVTGEWAYRGEKEYREADVVNVRECIWQKVGKVDAVPGKVINSFIPSRTVQAVDDESVGLYSQFLYNQLSQQDHYSLPDVQADLFSLISSEDCEDLVGLFLQEKGYRIIPSSCRSDTPAYEFVLKHSETGVTAVAQVKQGYVDLDVSEYSDLPGEVYLFTSHGAYIGDPLPNVHCIPSEELKEFAFSKRKILSGRLQTWIRKAERGYRGLNEINGWDGQEDSQE